MAQHAQSLPGTHEAGHEHPSEAAYIRIAVILAIITIVEVAIYYIDKEASWLIPALMVLGTAKFILVVAYFMHLKFDDSRLALIFSGGMVLALGTFVGLFVLMHFHKAIEFTAFMTSATRP
ncbi:MAG: cytochrome C oxidase subunit IV family protein [Thermomicrobiales bacterium]